MSREKDQCDPQDDSRRDFMAVAGSSLAALSALAAGCADSTEPTAAPAAAAKNAAPTPQAPFDSVRDYIAALEAHGLLLRVPRIDQDRYQTTALLFRAIDRHGMFGAPAMLFENIKIDGEWKQGPVLANHQGHWNADC
jgi:4-hydroxy-3-polyprenylbenzoate decarboxylase